MENDQNTQKVTMENSTSLEKSSNSPLKKQELSKKPKNSPKTQSTHNNQKDTMYGMDNFKLLILLDYVIEETPSDDTTQVLPKSRVLKQLKFTIYDITKKSKIGHTHTLTINTGQVKDLRQAVFMLTEQLQTIYVKKATFCIIVDQFAHKKFQKMCASMMVALPKFFYKYFTIQQEFSRHFVELSSGNLQATSTSVPSHDEDDEKDQKHTIIMQLLTQGHEFVDPFVTDMYYQNTSKPKQRSHDAQTAPAPRHTSSGGYNKPNKQMVNPQSMMMPMTMYKPMMMGNMMMPPTMMNSPFPFYVNQLPDQPPMRHPHQHHHHQKQKDHSGKKSSHHKLTPSHKYKFHRQPVDPATCTVIRLRGLPWTSTKQDIIDFFNEVQFASPPPSPPTVAKEEEPAVEATPTESTDEATKEVPPKKKDETSKVDPAKDFPHILLMISQDGRSTGEAYVRLLDPTETAKAMKKDREHMGRRYIEIFLSSEEEFKHCESVAAIFRKQLAFSHVVRMKPCPTPEKTQIEAFFEPHSIENIFIWRQELPAVAYIRFDTMEGVEAALAKDQSMFRNRTIHLSRSTDHEMANAIKEVMSRNKHHHQRKRRSYHHQQQQQPMQPFIAFPVPPVAPPSQQQPPVVVAAPPPLASNDAPHLSTHIVRLRGLPFNADEVDIDDFFTGIDIVDGGIHMIVSNNDKRRATGEAFVELPSELALRAALSRNKAMMEDRYIEIFHASPQDMMDYLKRTSSPENPHDDA